MQTTNPAWQRRNNLAVLARAVWQNPGLSRRDLDRRFQIDKSSISRLVQVLLDLGLVETAGRGTGTQTGASAGGRPQVALRVAAYGQVWGLALWPELMRLTILNARGEVMVVRHQAMGVYEGDWERYLAQVLDQAAQAAQPLNLPLLGVGIGVPGWVDFDSGRILKSLSFGLSDYEPRLPLDDGLAVLWENDANCGAWSCQTPGDSASDALYVLGRGEAVGFGLVIAGKLHRGWRHRAGEYGARRADLMDYLRTTTQLLDPRTIYLGGDLKISVGDLASALGAIGWEPPVGLLRSLDPGVDEVSLGAAQLVLDELFQLPSHHRHSLFRAYGTAEDAIWRGITVKPVGR